MAGIVIKNKIGPGDLGNPLAARDLPEGSKEKIYLGSIIGMASGLTYRANPNGDAPSVGFTGVFEGTPSDATASVIRAGTLFLPGSIADMVEKAMLGNQPRPVTAAPKRGAHVDVPTEQLPIAIEISTEKSNNVHGYAYDIQWHTEQKKVDVLEELRAMHPKLGAGRGGAPRLAAPQAPETKQTAAPTDKSKTSPAKKSAKRK